MKIAIIGLGGIGSTFAFQLSHAGHEVTGIARGKRLEQLRRDQAIVNAQGQRAAVQVSPALDPTVAYDLVLVTVLASQVDAVLPALAASRAGTVMFMFNTFESLNRLRDVVGAARFAFGFPAILAGVEDGILSSQIYGQGQLTTVTNAVWAKVFIAAGIPTVVYPDMQSWLRTHAALMVPMMIAIVIAHQRHAGVSWAEAMGLARAMNEGLHLVRQLGNTITPTMAVILNRLPAPLVAALLWTVTRFAAIRKAGAAGPGEARMLIDAMDTAAPGQIPMLLAVRPS